MAIGRLRKAAALIIAAGMLLSLTACGKDGESGYITFNSIISAGSQDNTTAGEAAGTENITFDDSDYYADYSDYDCTYINFNHSKAVITGEGAQISDGIITISKGGRYVLSGDYEGRIYINAGEKETVTLYLNGVTIESDGGPAIYEEDTEKVILSLCENTDNIITDSEEYDSVYSDYTACMFFKDSLTVNGTGRLKVSGQNNDAITSKDDLTIMDGNISITAADEGMVGRDKLTVNGGNINITSQGSGLKTSNEEKGDAYFLGGSININAGNDGINAVGRVYLNGTNINISADDDGIHADTELNVNAGSIIINKSYEGLESASININGGDIAVTSEDDGLNAASGNGNSEDDFGSANGFGGFGDGKGPDGFSKTNADNSNGFGGRDNFEGFQGSEGAGAPERPENFDGAGNFERPEGFAGNENPEKPGDLEDFGSFDGKGRGDGFGNRQGGGMQSADTSASITINGGKVYVNAGGDGIDSNGMITMNGGYVFVEGPTDSMNGAVDYETGFINNGGVIIAIGSKGMYQSVSEGSSCAVINYIASSAIPAESTIKIKSGDKILYEFTASKRAESILISSPEITEGSEYTVEINGSTETVTAEAGGANSGFMQGGFGKRPYDEGENNKKRPK